MSTTKLKDWELNIKVKAEFVRHWIDTQRINISTTSGTVYVKGNLVFKGGKVDINSPLSIASQLKATERSIRTIMGVKNIKFDFEEWEKSGNMWRPKSGKQVKQKG